MKEKTFNALLIGGPENGKIVKLLKLIPRLYFSVNIEGRNLLGTCSYKHDENGYYYFEENKQGDQ